MSSRKITGGQNRRQGSESNDRRGPLQYFLRPISGAPGHREIEFLLAMPRKRLGGRSDRCAERPENPKAALDSIGTDGIWDNEQIAAWITNLVSFHGANLRQGVGHGLS